MEKKQDGWHFEFDGFDYGPYQTKAEAESDQRGLERFERFKDRRGFITTDNRKIT